MQIFIMAQGQQIRWTPAEYPVEFKCLIKIGDENNLSRQIRLFGNKGNINLVTTKEIANQATGKYNLISLRVPGTIVRGIYQTTSYWDKNDRLLFVLGDVIFSRRMANFVCRRNSFWSVYGREGKNILIGNDAGEIFAMSIPGHEQQKVKNRLSEAITCSSMCVTKLWHLYSMFEELKLFQIENDWTDDIDSLQAYEAFGEKLIKFAEQDI